jgi:hypothetical protein
MYPVAIWACRNTGGIAHIIKVERHFSPLYQPIKLLSCYRYLVKASKHRSLIAEVQFAAGNEYCWHTPDAHLSVNQLKSAPLSQATYGYVFDKSMIIWAPVSTIMEDAVDDARMGLAVSIARFELSRTIYRLV